MKSLFLGLAALVLATASPALAETRMVIFADIPSQKMVIDVGNKHFQIPFSSARKGYETPVGDYHAEALVENYWSVKYNAPMPHAIFFDQSEGLAIHAADGKGEIKKILAGIPDSHGCIRLLPQDAENLFLWVQYVGRENVKIIINNNPLPPA